MLDSLMKFALRGTVVENIYMDLINHFSPIISMLINFNFGKQYIETCVIKGWLFINQLQVIPE